MVGGLLISADALKHQGIVEMRQPIVGAKTKRVFKLISGFTGLIVMP